jgi:hypothetical protein
MRWAGSEVMGRCGNGRKIEKRKAGSRAEREGERKKGVEGFGFCCFFTHQTKTHAYQNDAQTLG